MTISLGEDNLLKKIGFNFKSGTVSITAVNYLNKIAGCNLYKSGSSQLYEEVTGNPYQTITFYRNNEEAFIWKFGYGDKNKSYAELHQNIQDEELYIKLTKLTEGER